MRRLLVLLVCVVLFAGCGAKADTAEPSASTTPASDPSRPSSPIAPPGPRSQVLLAGDSLMASLTPALRSALGLDRRQAPFLLFPQLPLRRSQVLPSADSLADRTDVLVLMLGVWESAALTAGENQIVDVDDPDWRTAYQDEVLVPWLEELDRRGTEVVWVSMIPVQHPLLSLGVRALNRDFRSSVERVGSSTYVDAEFLLADENDRFRATIDIDGEARRLTARDGLHLCPAGAAMIAEAVVPALPERLQASYDPAWQRSDWTTRDREMGEDWYEPSRCA